jgi:acyl-coenzyme A synthetase/AMP-(fatty) acid ligase
MDPDSARETVRKFNHMEGSMARSLTFDLLEHAQSTPNAPALLLPDGALSYRQLDEAVWRFSQHLHAQGLGPGEVLGLTITDELTLVLTLLAVIRLGATACSIPRSATPVQRREMAARGAIKSLATDQPELADTAAPLLLVDRSVLTRARATIYRDILCETPTAPWLLITGSGSTGVPKLMAVSHAQTVVRSRIATQALRVTGNDRVTSLSHFDFSTSKFRLHEAFSVGAAFALQVWGQPDCLDYIRQRALSVVYATVFHAETLLARLPPDARSVLGSLRVLELTASTVSDDLRLRIQRQLCGNLHVRYAINEAGAVSIASPPTVFSVAGTVGKPLPGVVVEIVDREHRPVAPGAIGLIRIRSPGVVDSYRGNDDATRQSFAEGWFTPGDLGRFTEDGELIYCGRADHMMIMNGINIYPAEIERVMTSHPEVLDAAAVPVRHMVHQDIPVCAVTLKPGAPTTGQDLLLWASEQLGAHRPHRVLVLEQIPRNHEGKLVRAELAALINLSLAATA